MLRLDGIVDCVDEVHGFGYWDERDLLGFVDGAESPTSPVAAVTAGLIGEEGGRYAGGSYVIVQKYVHDLAAWDSLPVEEQELVIGRRKLSDIELPDEVRPSNSQVAAMRAMFIGNPPGNHDRILDYSTPLTGCLFFVPPAEFLEDPAAFSSA